MGDYWNFEEESYAYDFHDTTEDREARIDSIPAEALRINGEYIENLIEGYRTLYVSGRELLAQELTATELTWRSGSLYRSRRYPERVITVGFQMKACTSRAFREAFNRLAGILNVENAELIFHDEPDKFFVGTPSGVGDIEPGRNVVTGEFEITCSDPFKYSVKEYEVYPSSDDGKTFVFDYNGTVPVYPTLEVDFASEEDEEAIRSEDEPDYELEGKCDCGYVAFFDTDEHIIQFGSPDEVNLQTVSESQTLVNQSFKTAKSWGSSARNRWSRNTGRVSSSDVSQMGSVKAARSVSTDPNCYLTAKDFGSWTKWHGPSITRTIPADQSGAVGAADCKMTCAVKVCIGNEKGDEKQIGSLQALLVSGSGDSRKIVAGVAIVKKKAGKDGFIRFYVNDQKKQDVKIDLSYHNRRFGTNRAKSKGVKAIDTIKTITIKKTGSKVVFNVGGVKKTFKDSALGSVAVTQITFAFLQYGTKTPLSCLGLYSVKFVKNNCAPWKNVVNTFGSGDVLVADCSSGTILLNDVEEPDLGAPGNDWERFLVHPGTNQVMVSYSDWVEAGYEPIFKLRYREAFL